MPGPGRIALRSFGFVLAAALGLSAAAAQGATPAGPEVAPPAAGAAASGEEPQPQYLRDALLAELSTASYYELAAKARESGLPDSGNADEIRARLYARFGLQAPVEPASKGRTITIERAGEATYAKLEEDEDGLVKASGGVVLSLVETNGDTHRIQADSVTFDRTRSSLTARGSVRYERKSGSTIEIFSGEALSASLEDWSGVFIDGKVRRAGSGATAEDRGIVITADTIMRRSAEVMVLKDGVISSCDADDPHYAVRAGRVWLLGDKEWAISDAVFSLGNVPILWLPFFYYPGDEMIFHPVIGYRSREGRYLQTTVYLVGAKPAKQDMTSILSIKDTGPAKPTVVKGLFLRRIAGPPPKDLGSLKTMADAYSGLGGFAGIQGSFPKLAFLDKTDFFAGLGLSRSLFHFDNPSSYSPYAQAGNWASVWNASDLLGLALPFRYGLDLSTSLRSGGLSASLSLPIYSDPFFDEDFRNRSEDMDWLKILSTTPETATVSDRTQLIPSFSSALSLKPKALDPWLSSIEINKASATMTLYSKPASTLNAQEGNALYVVDPRRSFFYPWAFRPIEASATFRGTLLGAGAKPATPPKAAGSGPEIRNPWTAAEDPAPAAEGGGSAPGAGPGPSAPEAYRMPARAASAGAYGAVPLAGTLGWSFSPSVTYEDIFLSDPWTRKGVKADGTEFTLAMPGWNDPEDIDFSKILYDILTYRLAGSLDASAAYGELLSSSLGLSYSDQKNMRSVNPEVAVSPANKYILADALYENRRVGGNAKLSIKPFASSWMWSATSLGWGIDATLYGRKYDSASSAIKESWLAWDPASITSHNVTLNLAARPKGLAQSLTLVANLPPLLDSFSGRLALNSGFASFSLQSRMYRKEEGAAFSYDPIGAGVTIGSSPGPVLSDSFVYDASGGIGPISNSASLAWSFLRASLISKRTRSYKPVANSGWVAYGEESFGLSDLSLELTPKIGGDAKAGSPTWSLGTSVALSQSLLRFSESSLSFDFTAELKVSNSFGLSFSSRSQNSAAWRYYTGFFRSQLAEGDLSAESFQVNPLADVWDALSIWDGSALRKSLLKLKAISVKATADLHDWTLSAEVSTKPYKPDAKTYSLDTSFSVLLAWKDIPAIKSTVKKDSTGISF